MSINSQYCFFPVISFSQVFVHVILKAQHNDHFLYDATYISLCHQTQFCSYFYLLCWHTVLFILLFTMLQHNSIQIFTPVCWKYSKHRNSYSSFYCSQIRLDRYMGSITVELNFKEFPKNMSDILICLNINH